MPHDVQVGDVQVGTILMSQWPPLFGLESEPTRVTGAWSRRSMVSPSIARFAPRDGISFLSRRK